MNHFLKLWHSSCVGKAQELINMGHLTKPEIENISGKPKPMRQKSRMVVVGVGRGKGELICSGYKVSVMPDE